MCSYAPLPSTNDRLFEDYLASSNQQEGIYIGGAPQDSNLDLSMIENNDLTNIAGESSMLLPEEPKLKVLYDAVWKYGSDVWGQNAQTAEAPQNQSAYSSGQQCYFDRLPTSSEFDDSKEKFDCYSRFIDPSLLSNPSSSPVFAGELDAAEFDTDIEDKVHGAVGSYGLQKNSESPPSSENWGSIASNNIERNKRMLVEGLSTMLDQFSHALEPKNNVSCKDELPTSSGGTQRVSLETEAPNINGRRRIKCQFPDCNKKKGFKNMQTYTIHMRKHQDCSTKALPAYPSQVSDIDLANPGLPLPYVIPPPVEMEDNIFRCPYAGCRLAPFKSINTFRRHCDSVHSGKEAECPFCMLDRSGRKDGDNSKKAHLFTRADALQKHLKRVHPTIEKNDSRVLDVMRSLRRGNGKGVIWDKTTEPAGKGFEGRDENGMLVVASIAPKRKCTSTKACKDHSRKLKKAKLHENPSKKECGPGGAKEEAKTSPHSSLSISSHYYPSFNSSSSFSSFIDSSSSLSPSTNGSTEIVVPLRKRQRTSTAAAWNGKTGAKVSELKREVDSNEEIKSAKRQKHFHASDMLCGLGEAAKKENAPEFLGLCNEVTGQNVALKSKALEGGGSGSSFEFCLASLNHNAGGHQIQSSDTPASVVTHPAPSNNWTTENAIDTDTWRHDCPRGGSRGGAGFPVSIKRAGVREFIGNHVKNSTTITTHKAHGMLMMEEKDHININNSGTSLASNSSIISQNGLSGSSDTGPHDQPNQVHAFGLSVELIPESQYTHWLSYISNHSPVPME